MIKNTIKINHPLTVIAVFSMLTEASAAVSLPYIDSEHQKIYVWFLIIFPSLLITLFFLTLNFNNKKLYTPADLSKAENTQEGFSRPLDPCQEQANSPENTSTSAQLFIAPEKAHATLIAKSHVLGAELKTLHLIDLSHLHLVPPDKSSPDDVLHIYYKATRKYKNNNPKHNVLLLLTNQHSTIAPEALRLAIDNFKHTSVIGHTTIFSYNTDAHRLTLLNSPCPSTGA